MADQEKTADFLAHPIDPNNNSSAMVSNEGDHTMPGHQPHHSKALALQIAAMTREEYEAADRKLLWKIDKNLIPWMT